MNKILVTGDIANKLIKLNMNKEKTVSQTTEPAIAVDTVLAPVLFLISNNLKQIIK